MSVVRKDPVIILGMHRSGTTLLAEILQSLGVFLGETKGIHLESPYFRKLNKWILNRLGHGRWDRPVDVMGFLKEKPGLREAVVEELREKSDCAEFFKCSSKGVGLKKDKSPLWAWKDPRTMLIWPFWHEIFPKARFVFLYRNGIDVASSLIVREEKRIDNICNRIVSVDSSKYLSLRCMDIERAFRLWEEYHEICFNHYTGKSVKFFNVCYEDLLNNPESEISRICNFIELKKDQGKLDSVCCNIDSVRAFHFLGDSALLKYYDSVKTSFWMKKFGYDRIPNNME